MAHEDHFAQSKAILTRKFHCIRLQRLLERGFKEVTYEPHFHIFALSEDSVFSDSGLEICKQLLAAVGGRF